MRGNARSAQRRQHMFQIDQAHPSGWLTVPVQVVGYLPRNKPAHGAEVLPDQPMPLVCATRFVYPARTIPPQSAQRHDEYSLTTAR